MFGLKGNNVKLSAKPKPTSSTGIKGSSSNSTSNSSVHLIKDKNQGNVSSIPDRTSRSSASSNSNVMRRAQSAVNIDPLSNTNANYTKTTVKAKALFTRRPTATSNLPRSTTTTVVRQQNNKIMNRSQSHEIISQDHIVKDKRDEFLNRGRKPFSFANDSSVVNYPTTISYLQQQMNSTKSKTLNSIDEDNKNCHSENSHHSDTLEFEIREDPETELQNISSGRSIQTQTLIQEKDEKISELDKSDQSSKDQSKMFVNDPKAQGDFDKMLIAHSDNLVKDIVHFCGEMGLSIENIPVPANDNDGKSKSGESQSQSNSPHNLDLDRAEKTIKAYNVEDDYENCQLLCDISCPFSLLDVTLTPEKLDRLDDTTRKTPKSKRVNDLSRKGSVNLIEFSPNTSSVQSRQQSAGVIKGHKNGTVNGNGNGDHRDNEEMYQTILTTLKLIEEEEEKGTTTVGQLIEYIKRKSPKSFSPEQLNSLPPSRPHSSTSISNHHNHKHKCSCPCSPLPPPQSQYQQSPSIFSARSCQDRLYSSTPVLPLSARSLQTQMSARSEQKSESQTVHDHENQNNLQQDDLKNSKNWDSLNETTKDIFSYLDGVEKADKETLFNIKFEQQIGTESPNTSRRSKVQRTGTAGGGIKEYPSQTLENLIRKGSAELAREIITLDRKLEEAGRNIGVLEETLINQRELNMRNLKNSERDLKKRLKLQQEEFEMALTRHQAFVDQLITEKRTLQEKCEKILKASQDTEEKFQAQIKNLQEKHLEEIKRIRKMQENSEKVKKQKWLGEKKQEMKELTVKGLEPEVQRIIQRHQKEMAEMRAYHSDQMKEAEERWERKFNMQSIENREKMDKEKEDLSRVEREHFGKKLEFELRQRDDEYEAVKRRILQDFEEERKKFQEADEKFAEILKEGVRKAQIKGEVETENLKYEYESKISNLSKKHENEIKSLKDVFKAEKDMIITANAIKYEENIQHQETTLTEKLTSEKQTELKELEKKLRDEFEVTREVDSSNFTSKLKKVQDKFLGEISDYESSEKELKQRFSHAKAELLAREEEIFTFKTSLSLKDKQIAELSESNMKMMEERANLTALIRREFSSQMELLEEDSRNLKATIIEIKSKIKYDQEMHLNDVEKLRLENNTEIEKVGIRVKQALERKEEAINELQKQLEKSQIHINHLEELLETQRKDFVQSIQKSSNKGIRK